MCSVIPTCNCEWRREEIRERTKGGSHRFPQRRHFFRVCAIYFGGEVAKSLPPVSCHSRRSKRRRQLGSHVGTGKQGPSDNLPRTMETIRPGSWSSTKPGDARRGEARLVAGVSWRQRNGGLREAGEKAWDTSSESRRRSRCRLTTKIPG